MKQYVYTWLAVVFLSLCTACTEADIFVPEPGSGEREEGVPLSVKNLGMWMEVESRSIVTGGPENKTGNPNPLTAVGVCVTKTNSSGTVSLYDNAVRSQLFTYNATQTPAAWELGEGEGSLLLYTEKGTVYGYAPAEKSVSLTGMPKVPVLSGVKVLDKQKFIFNDGGDPAVAATDVQWETDQEDYLYGIAQSQVDRWHPEVSLSMQHALAKVSFRVLEANDGMAFDGCQVAKVVMKSSSGFKKSSTAKLNLSTGELSGTMQDADELWFTADGDLRAVGSGVSIAADVPVQAFGLVIPVTNVAATLELTLNDGRVFNMSPSGDADTPVTFTATWEKGKNYIYNLRLQPQGIELADITVAAWNDGGAYDVPME